MAWPVYVTELNTIEIFLGLFMILFMLTSGFITNKLALGAAPVAFLIGIIFGPKAASLMNPLGWHDFNTVLLEFSRLVLAIQSFGNAIELPKRYLERHWKSIAYILGPILAISWLITTCLVKLMVPSFQWKHCLIAAACFNAIDPVLAATVLSGYYGRRVPKHLRDLLRTEAAANGITTNLILDLATTLLRFSNASGQVATRTFSIALPYETLFGTLAGILIGYAARRGIRTGYERDTIDRSSLLAYYLSIALFGTGFGTIIGVDEVNLAFFAGIGLDNDDWYQQKTADTWFASAIDLVLNLGYFAFLGSTVPWKSFDSDALGMVPWRLVVGTFLIFLFRRLPVILLFKPLIPDIKTWREAAFYGHFGPIGAAAIFATLAVRSDFDPGAGSSVDAVITDPSTKLFLDQLWALVSFVVLCSSVVHGTSVALFVLGRRVNTLAVTVSYTQAADEGPSWMERLPRLQPRTAGYITSSSETDIEPARSRQNRRRTPAVAYQFGNTIIVEDEDGNVLKNYDVPVSNRTSKAPEGNRQHIRWGDLTDADSPQQGFLRQLQALDPDGQIQASGGETQAGPSNAEGRSTEIDEWAETPAEKRRRLAALGLSRLSPNDEAEKNGIERGPIAGTVSRQEDTKSKANLD